MERPLFAALLLLFGAHFQHVSAVPASTDLPPILPGSARVSLQTVASGLVAPLEVVPAPDGSSRLFIVDQIGKVRLVKNDQLVSTPFLDVSARLVAINASYDERGLLGLAFHPNFNDSTSPGFHKLYTFTSEPASGTADFPQPGGGTPDHQAVLAEWVLSGTSPDQVDPTSRREVLRIDKPQSNHNGGEIAFRSTDGYLYLALGDGGAGNDNGTGHATAGNGQTLTTALGKILRIDPLDPTLTRLSSDAAGANGKYRIPSANPFSGSGSLREIFAYGFRNPYRFSFDSQPGNDRLIVADVGQNHIEEVDNVLSAGNYGWRRKEGSFLFDSATGNISVDPSPDAALEEPVLEYDHDDGTSVIGGFVYRGTAVPGLTGKYLFADYQSPASHHGRLFLGDLENGTFEEVPVSATDLAAPLLYKGLGRDASGELYVTGSTNAGPNGATGVVVKVVARNEVLSIGAGSGGASQVRTLRRDGSLLRYTAARGSAFRGGIPVAVADVNGDGIPDLITGCGRGGAPAVVVFDGVDNSVLANFLVTAPSFRGGVFVAAADFDGDGKAEIVTGLGSGGPPQVSVFPGTGGAVIAQFNAYPASFRGGVRVATGDVQGTGTPLIATGAGAGGAPQVSVFTRAGVLQASFLAYAADFHGGVFVAVGDTDGNGVAEIVTGPGSGGGPNVRVYGGNPLALQESFNAYTPTFRGGVHVGIVDLQGVGQSDLVTAPATGASTLVRIFGPGTHEIIRQFNAFPREGGSGPFATGRSD